MKKTFAIIEFESPEKKQIFIDKLNNADFKKKKQTYKVKPAYQGD